MSEIYQYFANRTSPSGDRASRKQRKREKGRQGRKKLEPEHFVKIANCSPMPSRPLQGLWKSPFCPEEEYIYDSRMHLRPLASAHPVHGQSSWMENEVVSRILDINSSYDLVIPNLAELQQILSKWREGYGSIGM
ncbi:F-box protein [Camellia lanceoleosa]|uniref:F-box protein n=1 Tax=Camellia lanceoleosa TaxID=1840588 RepID=A0ACC0GTS9_9ERIC|nr:F-box protein [Camellia lanceoleosa]